MDHKIKTVALPKHLGWIFFTILVFIDAFLTVIRGAEGNPLWIPVVKFIGINRVLFLVPLILPLYYFVVKAISWVVKRVDRLPQAEEILLTTLVLIYAVFDVWLIAVDFFGFRFIRSFYHTIPFLIAVGFVYALLAEYLVKRQK